MARAATKPRIIDVDDVIAWQAIDDTTPPTLPPPAPLPLAQPKPHRVSAWRHDGGMDSTNHATEEIAKAHAAQLHWATYWKYAVVCLAPWQNVIETKLISEPS